MPATHTAPSLDGAALKVTRVTMPRYEVEFRRIEDALACARQLHDKRAMMLPASFAEAPGAQLVLDLSARGMAFSVALLFRIITVQSNCTVVEWWARRKTDPALLDLWLDALESQHGEQRSPGTESLPKVSQASLQAAFDLCRRALSKNPFTVLGVHWSSPPNELREASVRLTNSLDHYRGQTGLTPRMKVLLDEAAENAPKILAELNTRAGRQAARARFVPENQIENAINLLATQREVARLRGDDAEAVRIAAALAEMKTR